MKNRLNILKNKRGVTFVETMLAVAILAIIAVPLLSTVLASVTNNATAKEKTEAIALAEMTMGNIKAQAGLSAPPPTPPPPPPPLTKDFTKDNLVSYHSIIMEKEGKVKKDDFYPDNTIDVNEADHADIELVITQGIIDGEVSFIVKDYNGKEIHFNKVDVNKNIKLDIYPGSSEFIISASEKTDSQTTVSETTASGDISNTSNIKMKVSYTDSIPSNAEQLKVVTYVESNNNDIFKVYVMDNDEANSGVNFIGRKNSQFIVKHLSSGGYGKINSLYKITVYIVKKSAAISNVLELSKLDKRYIVYETSSYVKK